jgi:hypothetical protein
MALEIVGERLQRSGGVRDVAERANHFIAKA